MVDVSGSKKKMNGIGIQRMSHNMEPIADKTVEPTDSNVVPAKEKPSLKEQAMELIKKRVSCKDGRVYPIKRQFSIGNQVWRPFDKYVTDKWMSHASRLSSLRDKPILTPFGKKMSWEKMIPLMSRYTKEISDPHLRDWELRELSVYGVSDYVRGKFDPVMYLAKQALYDPMWYPEIKDLEVNLDLPKFRPLKRISDIDIRADAKTANVGFPWLTRLSESGQPVTQSPVYLAVVEASSKWASEVHHLPKVTPQTVKSISPPIAVFERAQGGGRPVQAVSKKIVFNEYKYSQPLTDASESVPEYASGDRLHLLDNISKLINGEIHEMAKGDDVLARLKDGSIVGADASSMDAGVSDQQSNLFANAVASQLTGEDEMLWLATCYAASEVEMVNCVGMVQKTSRWGTTSGSGSTTTKNTYLSIWRERASSRSSVDAFLKDMNKYGLYKLEFKASGAVVFLKLYVSDQRPEYIHGSIVRSLGALLQREDPVLLKRKADFMIEEEARLKAIGGNMYGHPLFEEFAKFVKSNWQFRAPSDMTEKKAESYMNKSRDKDVSGEYERKGIKAFTDLVSG
jgi:hypothetical protein